MKPVIAALSAALLLAAAPSAFAQDNHDNKAQGQHQDRGNAGHQDKGGAAHAKPQAVAKPQAQAKPQAGHVQGFAGKPDGLVNQKNVDRGEQKKAKAAAVQNNARPEAQRAADRNGNNGRGDAHVQNGAHGRPSGNVRLTRSSNPEAFRHNGNVRRVRGASFHYPSGYSYRRWSVGQRLPSLFISSPYFFTDYSDIGLEAPPYGYDWVRYGPDALLVDEYTGEVVDVAYGVFY